MRCGWVLAMLFLALVTTLEVRGLAVAQSAVNPKLAFWDHQRKGANGDGGANRDAGTTPEEWFRAAYLQGIEFVRLIPENWPGEGRDFLLGDANHFESIPADDLALLESVLDTAQRYGIKIVLAMFSLPGARNRQSNGNEFDYRLWNDPVYQEQAFAFWNQLAGELKNHPAVVGYNPLNEPHPGRQHDLYGDGKQQARVDWLNATRGSLADLNRFNRSMVDAIRAVDDQTPVILDGWMHASVEGLTYLEPVDDPAVLYNFHYYGPWIFATYRVNQGRFSYPDRMPVDEDDGDAVPTTAWTRNDIEAALAPARSWAESHGVPANRILVGEFGSDRRVSGTTRFLADTIRQLNEQEWHWAFYSFRSSEWDGLDYELGTEKLGWKYWQQREQGVGHEFLIDRHDNPLWEVIAREFEPPAD